MQSTSLFPSLAIQAHDIRRSLPFGNQQINILNGVTFNVERGAWIALTGPSGSGKSTLLAILGGLDTPTSGTIAIDGIDITTLNETKLAGIRNQKIGIVFQSFNLIPTLTAQENVEAPLYVHPNRKHATQRARAMLDLVGLADRLQHRPHQLSGGQQQRVAIARALVTEPTLLVADEPTGNLDTKTSAQILELFEQLRKELGITLVIATHDNAVAAHADQELHMVDGCFVEGTV